MGRNFTLGRAPWLDGLRCGLSRARLAQKNCAGYAGSAAAGGGCEGGSSIARDVRFSSSHFSQPKREAWHPTISLYGAVTDMVSMLLVILPMVAVIFTLPLVVTVVA